MATVEESIREAKEMAAYLEQRGSARMKRIDAAFLLPRAKKWRAVVDIYLDETPGLKEVRNANIKMAKEAREKASVFNRKMMTGDMQLGMIMPPAYWDIISTCDPEFKEIMSEDTKGREDNRGAQIKMFGILAKTFPEFVVPADGL